MSRTGDLVTRLRLAKDWSRRRLAATAGLSPGELDNIENGRGKPGIDKLVKLADTLESSLFDLVDALVRDVSGGSRVLLDGGQPEIGPDDEKELFADLQIVLNFTQLPLYLARRSATRTSERYEGDRSDEARWRHAMAQLVLGSSYDEETAEPPLKAYGELESAAAALDGLGLRDEAHFAQWHAGAYKRKTGDITASWWLFEEADRRLESICQAEADWSVRALAHQERAKVAYGRNDDSAFAEEIGAAEALCREHESNPGSLRDASELLLFLRQFAPALVYDTKTRGLAKFGSRPEVVEAAIAETLAFKTALPRQLAEGDLKYAYVRALLASPVLGQAAKEGAVRLWRQALNFGQAHGFEAQVHGGQSLIREVSSFLPKAMTLTCNKCGKVCLHSLDSDDDAFVCSNCRFPSIKLY